MSLLRSAHLSFSDVAGRSRFCSSIRFGSVLSENPSVRFGSVRRISFPGSTRFVRLSDAVARSGSVWFVSASGSGRFQNLTVWFGSADSRSVSYYFLM